MVGLPQEPHLQQRRTETAAGDAAAGGSGREAAGHGAAGAAGGRWPLSPARRPGPHESFCSAVTDVLRGSLNHAVRAGKSAHTKDASFATWRREKRPPGYSVLAGRCRAKGASPGCGPREGTGREGASGQRAAPGDTPAGGRPAVGRRPNLLPRPVTRPRRQHAGLSAVGLGPGGEEGRVPRGRPSTACRGELGRGRGAAGSTMERARQAARRPLQNPEPGRPAAAPAAEVRGGDAERGQVGRERRPRGQPRREGGGGASGGRARLTRQAPPPPTALGKGHRKGARPEASARRAAPFGPLRPLARLSLQAREALATAARPARPLRRRPTRKRRQGHTEREDQGAAGRAARAIPLTSAVARGLGPGAPQNLPGWM